MAIVPKCEYCKHNEGENKQFGFMWKCKVLGYCVTFGYKKRHTTTGNLEYCKAQYIGKGSFVLDEVKYKELKKQNKK